MHLFNHQDSLNLIDFYNIFQCNEGGYLPLESYNIKGGRNYIEGLMSQVINLLKVRLFSFFGEQEKKMMITDIK